jgi:hypothetical protein
MLTFRAVPFVVEPSGVGHVARFIENEDRWYRGWRAAALISMVPWILLVVLGIVFAIAGSASIAITKEFWIILCFGLWSTTMFVLAARWYKNRARILCVDELTKKAWVERVKRTGVIETYTKIPIEDVQVVVYPLKIQGFATPLKFRGHCIVAHCGDAWIVLGVAKTKTELEACVELCFANGLRVEESGEEISSELNVRIGDWRRGLRADVLEPS